METIEIPHLQTVESPRQIFEDDFPKKQWPISGGWGYDEYDPCVIELDTENEGVPFEHDFILYRTYEEQILFKPQGEGYAGITVKQNLQMLIQKDGRVFDKVDYTITAFHERDRYYGKSSKR